MKWLPPNSQVPRFNPLPSGSTCSEEEINTIKLGRTEVCGVESSSSTAFKGYRVGRGRSLRA